MPKCRATILGGDELLEIQLVTGCRSWMVPLSTPAELAISASRDLPFSRSRLLENLSKTRFALVHCGYFVALMRLKQGGDLPGSAAGTLARPNTGNRCTEVVGAVGFGQSMSGREGRPESYGRTRVRENSYGMGHDRDLIHESGGKIPGFDAPAPRELMHGTTGDWNTELPGFDARNGRVYREQKHGTGRQVVEIVRESGR